MNIDEAFAIHTQHTITASERHIVKCRKGLWSVDAPTARQALNEARNYFRQYYADGEYDN